MATFVPIPDPTTRPPIHLADRHLGKRLYAQRQRLGIPLETAALALQVDTHTVTTLEAGGAIPPRLSARLRGYLQKLEAMNETTLNDEPTPQDHAEPVAAPPAAPSANDDPDEPTATADSSSFIGHPSALPFPDWVRAQRKARGWTQRELGQRAGMGHATINKLENGYFTPSPVLRARLEATLTDDSPALSPDPSPLAPVLDADTSAALRSRLIRALVDRKLSQRELAHQLGLRFSAITDIIRRSDILIPQDLAAKLTAWLSEETLRDDTPSTGHLRGTQNATPADSSFSPHPSSLPQETPMPDPALVHPDILPEADTAPADDAPTEAEVDADPAPSDSSFSAQPSSLPPRLFNSFQFHLPRPSSRDVALLALLDKFPSFHAMTTPGEQVQWFRWFDALARLALAHPDKE